MGKNKNLNLRETLQELPPDYPIDLLEEIKSERKKLKSTIVVLDDDPTGTQTVYDVSVLTEWSVDSIINELEAGVDIFYILTNSRSLTKKDANKLAKEIGKNLLQASGETGRDFLLISRSDSTLRGHYPNEVDAISSVLNYEDAITFLIPAFFEGGRFTIENVHYLQENELLIPVSETPFAADKTFGFVHANLTEYVEEKTSGKIKASAVQSISINELRTTSPDLIASKIKSMPASSVCVVNAVSYGDLQVFALGMLRSQRKALLRSAASIIPVLAGIRKKPLLDSGYFHHTERKGILVVVGSYVPKTSAQLEKLKNIEGIHSIEMDVKQILSNRELLLNDILVQVNYLIDKGDDVVLFTSRRLLAAEDSDKSLQIGQNVSAFITTLVLKLSTQPACILAKGGITSSDIATMGLGVKKALVVGQVAAGVPVWKLGKEAKFPGLDYIVFPGNVGSDKTLMEVFLTIKGNF